MKISLDSVAETITVDDVEISLALLRTMVQPDPSRWFRFMRMGDVVTVEAMDPDLHREFEQFAASNQNGRGERGK